MTETASQAATLAPADALRKLGSAGQAMLPVELRVEASGPPCRDSRRATGRWGAASSSA